METIRLRIATLAALILGLAGCVPRTAPPRPTAPAPAVPASTPTPQPVPTFSNWLDAPATPGDWSYLPSTSGGTALFGARQAAPLLVMRCDRTQRQVHLERAGHGTGSAMTLRAETMARSLPAQAVAGPPAAVRVSIGASDRLLDAMAFSKGRFAVELAGAPTLYVPAWPEITRVVEDCRA